MPDEDWWLNWYKKRRYPFFRSGVFGDIEEVFKEMEERIEREFSNFYRRTPKNLIRERTLPDGSKVQELGPFVYGYSVKIGPDGKPRIREFGNIKHEARFGRPRINIKEKRKPLIDVIAANDEVHIIAELPGVRKEDIMIRGTEKSLSISVDIPRHKFYREIRMHAEVNPQKAKSTYKNGVLEVTLPKKKNGKIKGESIEIE
ncbi:MAG: Hsp20/alpha crystallin family protein [Candidatus Bathyarchaeota archaeon]